MAAGLIGRNMDTPREATWMHDVVHGARVRGNLDFHLVGRSDEEFVANQLAVFEDSQSRVMASTTAVAVSRNAGESAIAPRFRYAARQWGVRCFPRPRTTGGGRSRIVVVASSSLDVIPLVHLREHEVRDSLLRECSVGLVLAIPAE